MSLFAVFVEFVDGVGKVGDHVVDVLVEVFPLLYHLHPFCLQQARDVPQVQRRVFLLLEGQHDAVDRFGAGASLSWYMESNNLASVVIGTNAVKKAHHLDHGE